jgi:urea transport system permease protein
MGSVNFTDAIDIPQRPVRDGPDRAADGGDLPDALPLALGPAGARHGAEPRDGRAVGINTRKVDRMTFALGCGVAGVAGAAFTTIGSTGPTAGSQYIVDTFLVVVFGGAQACSAPSPRRSASPRRNRCRSSSSVARWPRC